MEFFNQLPQEELDSHGLTYHKNARDQISNSRVLDLCSLFEYSSAKEMPQDAELLKLTIRIYICNFDHSRCC